MSPNFKVQLHEGKPLIGTFLTISSPEVAEILAGVGMDWLLIDISKLINLILLCAADTAGHPWPMPLYCPCASG